MRVPFHDGLRRAFDAAGGSPLAQAATVSPEGLPEARTVVLRGLGPEADAWFASDARSAKFRSLAVRPWLELCLFDGAAGVQWRLLGRAAVSVGDAAAREAWRALPRATRELFFSPPPGRPLEGGAAGTASEAAGDPPDSFAVVRLPPQRCDRLVLGPPLRRRIWRLEDGRWTGRRVVP